LQFFILKLKAKKHGERGRGKRREGEIENERDAKRELETRRTKAGF
jgi:hypothetical protein